ncbi:transcription factor domain family protein [Aspergillus tubingensis]|uniref:transcription factor domain family protein n=1 Tax=Aspergillus tubingensis TaxID=5068 RepID=UPI00157781FF|nr:fungal specific transcription factor domain family protein [Aspergillus tubingensis]GFN12678.1 fungal specific transcription factor domain family protein [Aspergillus tubingensis]GLB19622.1 hypothetical protein AtubIFM61612_009535 [Aspergillus tubingensis]
MTGSSNSFAASACWLSSQKDTETSVNRGDTEPDTSSDSDKDIFVPTILRNQQRQSQDPHHVNDLVRDISLSNAFQRSSGNGSVQGASTTSGQQNQHQQSIDANIVSSWAVAFGSSVQVQEGHVQANQIGDCHFDKGCDTSVSTRPPYKPFGQRRATRPNSINFRRSIRGRPDCNVRTHDADGDVIMRDAS